MSKVSIIGLTVSGPNEALSPMPPPTEEERQKLAKSAMRLVCKYGWLAFADALRSVCEEGARNYRSYHPSSASVWERRAQMLRELGKHS